MMTQLVLIVVWENAWSKTMLNSSTKTPPETESTYNETGFPKQIAVSFIAWTYGLFVGLNGAEKVQVGSAEKVAVIWHGCPSAGIPVKV